MMELYLKGLKNQAEEIDRRYTKATSKEILKDNSLINIWLRHSLTTRRTTLPHWEAALIF